MSKKLLNKSLLLLAVGFTLSDADVMAYAAQPDYNIVNYAVETTSLNQSDRWYADPNGAWYLRNEAGTGNVVNSWFQDLDDSWYLLAPEDGHMYAGLIHDTLTDRWYYCQVEHDGYYGRMAHKDGVYTINNQQVYLTFNQAHDGTFGALTSNIDALKSTGIPLVDVAGLPVNSAKADPSNQATQNMQEEDTVTPGNQSEDTSNTSGNTQTNQSRQEFIDSLPKKANGEVDIDRCTNEQVAKLLDPNYLGSGGQVDEADRTTGLRG